MALYAARRIGLALVIVFCSMVILFGMVYLIPGDPATIALGPLATPEMVSSFRIRMGLDRPIPVQLWKFFANAVRGDLGVDVWSERPVRRIIADVMPHTLFLTGTGLGWAILVGIPLGCYSARYRNSVTDKLTGVLSVGVIAIPSFVVALLLLLVFAVSLRWFPAIGVGEPGNRWDQASHLVLPSIAIGLGWVGYLARLVRASMLEVLGEGHIRTLRAFGLPERMVVFRYALRLAILPDDRASRDRGRSPPVRGGIRRDRLRAARHRQADLRRGARSKLSHRDGRRAGDDHRLRAVHAARRHRRRLVRSPCPPEPLTSSCQRRRLRPDSLAGPPSVDSPGIRSGSSASCS